MARLDFNVSDVPEDTGDRSFDPIPAGDYIVQVVESEIRDTKAGTGKQLVLTLEVVDGPFTGRKLWDRLNIVNQSPEAQRISQRSLADLCMAIGISDLRDSEVLHYRPL